MSIYGQIIILLAFYRAIRICMNEMHNNKYTLKVLHSQLTIKLSFFVNVRWPREQSVVPQKLQTR